MKTDLFLYFNGNCREVVTFYKNVFGLDEPKYMTYGEAPQNPEDPVSKEDKERILYTSLKIGDMDMMFSDVPSSMQYVKGNNLSITLSTSDVNEIKRIFDAFTEGGRVDMELQKTFYSECYGMVTDQFGIQWQLNHYSEV